MRSQQYHAFAYKLERLSSAYNTVFKCSIVTVTASSYSSLNIPHHLYLYSSLTHFIRMTINHFILCNSSAYNTTIKFYFVLLYSIDYLLLFQTFRIFLTFYFRIFYFRIFISVACLQVLRSIYGFSSGYCYDYEELKSRSRCWRPMYQI